MGEETKKSEKEGTMGEPLTGKTVRRSERTAAAANAAAAAQAAAARAAEGSVGSVPLGRMPVVRQHPVGH
jgi:hypothetical protein